MQATYAQKNYTEQKASANTAESVVDFSSQSATLQRHTSLADGVSQRAPKPRPNLTGMPDNLKSGIESLSGFSMDDVRVHYNSSKPATVQALAYTQGTDIHVAPGQEKHLPHEAWHVAQQMAGRVSPTTNINGMPVNDNAALEHEADVMGEKAVQCKSENTVQLKRITNNVVIQCLNITQEAINLIRDNDVPEPILDTFRNNPGNGPNLFQFGVTNYRWIDGTGTARLVFHETFSDAERTVFYSLDENNNVIILGIGFHSGRISGKANRSNDNTKYKLTKYSRTGRKNVDLKIGEIW